MGILEKFSLDGKVALVTGCRRGIGMAIAVAMAEAGADIVGVSATLEPSGSEVEKLVTGAGRSFRPYVCDLGNRKALQDFIARVKADCPPIDILVNNAGAARRAPAAEHSDEYWDEVLEVNLTAPFILSREFGREMLARGSGKIIFTASLMSFQGGINIVSYAASKGGIARLTQALANEWAAGGVNVNAVAPGYVATDLTAPLWSDEQRNKAILDRIPVGRWATPEDMAGAVVFLASSAADYIHGEIITVDGGWMGR